VAGVVDTDELRQVGFQRRIVGRECKGESRRVAIHSCPVSLESKHYVVDDAEGTEDAHSVEKARMVCGVRLSRLLVE